MGDGALEGGDFISRHRRRHCVDLMEVSVSGSIDRDEARAQRGPKVGGGEILFAHDILLLTYGFETYK